MPDGTVVQGVPEGITQRDLLARYNAGQQSQAGGGAGQQGQESSMGITGAVGGALDVARSAVTGAGADVVGGLMGLATLGTNLLGVTQDDPVAMIRKYQQYAYPVESESGQKVASAISTVSRKVAGAVGLQDAGERLGQHIFEQTGSPLEATVAQLMPDVASMITGAKIPQVVKDAAFRGAAKMARKATFNAARDETFRATRQTGFNVSASYGGMGSRTLAGASNRAEIARIDSEKNAERVVDLAKLNLKIPTDQPISRKAYADVRARMSLPYEQARALPDMPIDAEYMADLYNAGRDFMIPNDPFSPPEIQALQDEYHRHIGTYMRPNWNGNAAVTHINLLRSEADTLLRSDDFAKKVMGKVKRDTAGALEDRLARQADKLGQPELAGNLREARRNLAQLHVYEDATNFSTGTISARDIAAQREGMGAARVDPFTDELKLIADSAIAFPDSFMDVTTKGKGGLISVWERYALIGGLLSAVTGAGGYGHEVGGVAIAAGAAGPIGRKLVTSKGYQKAFMKPPKRTPGPIRRGAMSLGEGAQAAGVIAGADSGVNE